LQLYLIPYTTYVSTDHLQKKLKYIK
jgi:hypothetical protein